MQGIGRSLQMRSAALLQFRSIVLHPAADRGMIDMQAVLQYHPLEVWVAERVAQVPPDAQQHDLSLEVTAFEGTQVLLKVTPLDEIAAWNQGLSHHRTFCNTTVLLSHAEKSTQ